VFATLEEVIEFYDAGGGAGRGLVVPNQTLPSDSLHFTPREEEDLLAFLRALSDTAGTTAVEAPAARLSGGSAP
jgi:cytochrome c peroxidase